MRPCAWFAVVATMVAVAAPTAAHDVVWPGKPTGAAPPVPIFLQPFASADIVVQPETGEECTVAVTLQPVLSPGVIALLDTPNPDLEVKVRVTAVTLPLGDIVTANVQGEWHATGLPLGKGCTAVEPHPFAVQVVIGAPTTAQTPNTLPVGDPVIPLAGGYATAAIDHEQIAPLPLTFGRVYDSQLLYSPVASALGPNWMHNYDSRLSAFGSFADVVVFPGRYVQFEWVDGAWQRATSGHWDDQLASAGGGYRFLDGSSGLTHSFSSLGRLTAIEDRNGNALTVTQGAFGPLLVANGLGQSLAFSYSGSHLTQVTDQTGRSTSYSYQGDTLKGFNDALGRMTTYHYANVDAATLAAVQRPRGNTPLTQEYDAFFRVFRQTDAGGHATTLAFGQPAPGATTITDPLGYQSVHEFDGYGNLVRFGDHFGFKADYGYDADHRMTSYTDRREQTTIFEYNPFASVIAAMIDAQGQSTEFTHSKLDSVGLFFYDLALASFADGTAIAIDYDGAGRPAELTDQAGNSSTYTYNLRGQPLTVTNPAGGATAFSYFADGMLDKVTDAAGGVTAFTWNPGRRPSKVTYATGATRLLDWDHLNRLTAETDPRGKVTRWDYDFNGNWTKLTDRLQCVWTLSYNGDDRVTSLTDAHNGTTSFAYDERGDLKSQTNAAGEKFTFERNPLGLLATMLDPADHAWNFGYDADGHLVGVENPLGDTWSFERDPLGRVGTVITPEGDAHSRRFDKLGRLRMLTDPLFRKTSLNYDDRGLLEGYMAPGGIGASFARDALGGVTAITDPLGSVWTRERDSAFRLVRTVDPLGQATDFEYNASRYPERVLFPGGGTVQIPRNASGYPMGRIYSDGLAFSIAYDPADRPISASGFTQGYDFNGRIAMTNGVQILRDPVGRIASVRYAADKVVTYQYNARGLPWRVSDWAGGWMEFDYDAAARVIGAARANGVYTQTTYDRNGRVAGITEQRDQLTLSAIALKRDELGRVIEAERNVPQQPVLEDAQSAYGYDAASQIAGLLYDQQGRPKQDLDFELFWNLASSLTSYTFGGATVGMGYNALGMRTSRTAQGTTENYLVNYAFTLPSVGRVRVGGVDQRHYIHAPDGTLLWMVESAGNAHRYYHFDEVGSTSFLTGGDGVITDTYGITPYGETVSATGSTPNPYTWLGRYGVMQEPGLPLYYARARWYDARSGRFLSRDPLVQYGPTTINPYAYCGGEPLGCRDPTGLRGELVDAAAPIAVTAVDRDSLEQLSRGSVLDLVRARAGAPGQVAASPNRFDVPGSSSVPWPSGDGVDTIGSSLSTLFDAAPAEIYAGEPDRYMQVLRAVNKRPSLDPAGSMDFGAYGIGYGSAFVGGAPVYGGAGSIFYATAPQPSFAGVWLGPRPPPTPSEWVRSIVDRIVVDPYAANLFALDGSAFSGPIRNLPITPAAVKRAFGREAGYGGNPLGDWFPSLRARF